VGAIAARLRGLNPIIIEKAPVWGGTSALSGGGVWIPNNPLMKRDGVEDSLEAGLAYLDATIGDVGPASSHERRLAYLQEGPEMIAQLAELGFGWRRAPRYPDYYPDYPAGRIGPPFPGITMALGFQGRASVMKLRSAWIVKLLTPRRMLSGNRFAARRNSISPPTVNRLIISRLYLRDSTPEKPAS
jgi:hypothetical protein